MTLIRKAKVLFIIRVLLFAPAELTFGRETGFTGSYKVRRIARARRAQPRRHLWDVFGRG